ncbi:MAG: UDP-N-acetylglucosamine 1-carboxyvinyltransferase [Blautia sp.]
MKEIRIEGRKPLEGEIKIQGSKNAALPIMAAALLHKGEIVLHQCPDIADVHTMAEILKKLGAKIQYKENTMILDCSCVNKTTIDFSAGKKMRSSVIFLGSLLGRFSNACIPYPGGCVIGKRPIDLHLWALEKLGISFWEEDSVLLAQREKLQGTEIVFPGISVGATQNAILASVLAEGITRLRNCACEPEVVWLCEFLCSCGAEITGAGSRTICIRGVQQLHGTEYTIPPDRIVAGTYVCASAITRSQVMLYNAPSEEMKSLLHLYQKMGGQYEVIGGKLSLCSRWVQYPIVRQCTEVYPGFPTDLQSPLMAVLSTIPGQSCLVENIFEDRFRTADQLKKMGADIQVNGREALIRGGNLRGARVEAQELRGGAALVIAGLAAEGVTHIANPQYIERGYENICRDLRMLGAAIEIG